MRGFEGVLQADGFTGFNAMYKPNPETQQADTFPEASRLVLRDGDLQQAINDFIQPHNQKTRPFQIEAKPEDIVAAVKRRHQVLKSIH